MTLTKREMENRFNYHKPDKKKAEDHEFIRHECFKLCNSINDICPTSFETIRAIESIEMAMFWANAAIARNIEAITDDMVGDADA